MFKKVLLLSVVLSIQSFLFSDSEGKNILNINNEYFSFSLLPSVVTGTHVNGIGLDINYRKKFPIELDYTFISPSIGLYTRPYLFLTNIGIPGESMQLNIGTDLSICWGRGTEQTHTFRYYLNYYFTSNGTNQPYGGVAYTLSLNKNDITFSLDNDDAYFIATDKYRTTKGKIKFLRKTYKYLFGFSIGFLLWTGNLDGTEIDFGGERRDNSYELTGYGGDYSHGIAELSFLFDGITLSIGYDSETVREYIQNGWHNLYNRPIVPLVDRDDKIYFQLSYNHVIYQY